MPITTKACQLEVSLLQYCNCMAKLMRPSKGTLKKDHIREEVSKYCVYVTYAGQWTILKIKILEEKFISFISGILQIPILIISFLFAF